MFEDDDGVFTSIADGCDASVEIFKANDTQSTRVKEVC